MSWPTERTPAFYVHDRLCVHCGSPFAGFVRQKYCSPDCSEMSKRRRSMTAWGVPNHIIEQLTARPAADAS